MVAMATGNMATEAEREGNVTRLDKNKRFYPNFFMLKKISRDGKFFLSEDVEVIGLD